LVVINDNFIRNDGGLINQVIIADCFLGIKQVIVLQNQEQDKQ
jgi:hypothetical protein